jgi:hypothetical protein
MAGNFRGCIIAGSAWTGEGVKFIIRNVEPGEHNRFLNQVNKKNSRMQTDWADYAIESAKICVNRWQNYRLLASYSVAGQNSKLTEMQGGSVL